MFVLTLKKSSRGPEEINCQTILKRLGPRKCWPHDFFARFSNDSQTIQVVAMIYRFPAVIIRNNLFGYQDDVIINVCLKKSRVRIHPEGAVFKLGMRAEAG